MNMRWNRSLLAALLASTVTWGAFAQDGTSSAQSEPASNAQVARPTLKSAFKDHFLVGVAINEAALVKVFKVDVCQKRCNIALRAPQDGRNRIQR